MFLILLFLFSGKVCCLSQTYFIPFKCGDKWGYSYQDSLVIPCIYQNIENYEYLMMQKDSLFSLKFNNRFGIVNKYGKIILPFQYESVKIVHKDLFIVKKEGKYGVINQKTDLVIPFEYDEIYTSYFETFYCKKGGKVGVINFQGKIIIPCKKYEDIVINKDYQSYVFYNRVHRYQKHPKYSNFGLMDRNGKIILKEKYNRIIVYQKNVCVYSKMGAWLLDLENNLKKISKAYDEIGIFMYNIDFTWVRNGNLYGFIDDKGKEIIPLKYEDASIGLYDTYMNVKLNGKWGCVDKNNQVVIDFKYESLTEITNAFIFKLNNKAGLMDKFGKVIIENKYDGIGKINDSLWYVEKEDNYGLIDIKKGLLLPIEYKELRNFNYFKNTIGNLYFQAKHNGLHGIINHYGKVIIDFKYKSMNVLSYPNMILVSYKEDFEDAFFTDVNGKEYRKD